MTKTTAGIMNVGLCANAIEQAINRSAHLPGMAAFYGPSGYGKSFAATYAANKYRAYYVECKSSWTRKAFLLAVLKEMGVPPTKTLYEMTDQIAEQLVLSRRPLIVDEMDHLVEKKAVEAVRDIYEGSQAPILLIGEEQLPDKLQKWERFHGRVLDFVPAQPASLRDAEQLARIYAPGITIADDLLASIHAASKGSVRRICVNINRVREHARSNGLSALAARDYQGDFFTGQTPRRRTA